MSSRTYAYITTHHVVSQYLCYYKKMKIERSVFSQNLIRYRKQKGFSQADLAKAAGISSRMIGHYEISDTIPPIEKIEALSKALGVKPSQLLDDSNETEQNEIELTGIDTRSIKKLKDILSLSAEDRNDLYRILNKMLRKNQLEKKEIDANK
jgi:transcriptional regulator with XRE-family HTH domain